MLPIFFASSFSAFIRYNSIIQLENSYTQTKLGVVYVENDARFKKPTIVSQIPPFDDSWNWAIISPPDEKSTDQILCGDEIYLYNSRKELFLNTRYDEKLDKFIVYATRIPNGKYSKYNIECKNNKQPLETNLEFLLESQAAKCYLYTDFTAHHPEISTSYLVNCTHLSQKSLWSIDAGLFIVPPPTETTDNEL